MTDRVIGLVFIHTLTFDTANTLVAAPTAPRGGPNNPPGLRDVAVAAVVALWMILGVIVISAQGILFAWSLRPPPPVAFAVPGEQVTTEDGRVICTIISPLYKDAIVKADGWCADWQITPPVNGTPVDLDAGWVRRGPSGLQLHFPDGWRP